MKKLIKHVIGFLKMKYEMWLLRQVDRRKLVWAIEFPEEKFYDELLNASYDREEETSRLLQDAWDHENELETQVWYLEDRNRELERRLAYYEPWEDEEEIEEPTEQDLFELLEDFALRDLDGLFD